SSLSGLGPADILINSRAGEAEGAKVGNILPGRDQLGALVHRQGVNFLPYQSVDMVGELGGLLAVELLKGDLERLVDLVRSDAREVLLDVLLAFGVLRQLGINRLRRADG